MPSLLCYEIPASLCKDIEQKCAIWWHHNGEKRGMHWSSWKSLCKPKFMGGMGFRCMIEFNHALLAKQVWRIIQHPESLVAHLLKERYFKNVDIMEALRGLRPSYIWKSIFWSRELIVKGLQWRVGDGKNIPAFQDAWILGSSSGRSLITGGALRDAKVSDFITTGGNWDKTDLNAIFPAVEVSEILNIHIYPHGGFDHRFWKWDIKGKYLVQAINSRWIFYSLLLHKLHFLRDHGGNASGT